MTCKEKVLNWLKSGRPLDPATAWKQLGVYRLGARIYDLRREGWEIATRRKTVVNRDGNECIVADYVLIGHARRAA